MPMFEVTSGVARQGKSGEAIGMSRIAGRVLLIDVICPPCVSRLKIERGNTRYATYV